MEALNMEDDLVGSQVGSKGVMIQVCRADGLKVPEHRTTQS
ncbi:hypothetical protein AB0H37_25660 [Actinomadura sp. NPDC023710]